MSKLVDELVKELMMSPMKSNFTLSRDELIEVMFSHDVYRREGLTGAYYDITQREKLEKETPALHRGKASSRKERNN